MRVPALLCETTATTQARYRGIQLLNLATVINYNSKHFEIDMYKSIFIPFVLN